MASPDVRFGVAVPEGAIPGEALPCPAAALPRAEPSTVELPFDVWAADPAGWNRAEGDLCLRLGGVFADFPGDAGGGMTDAAGYGIAYRKALARCRRAAEAASAQGRLSALLLEFPASFSYSAAARRHLDRVLRDLAGLPLAVAFHGADWYSARVIEGLKARGVALCLLDMVREPGSPPSIDVVTSSLVYIKLRDGTDPPAWLPRIEALAAQAETVRVIFSGCDGRRAAEKATLMARLWQGRADGDSVKGCG